MEISDALPVPNKCDNCGCNRVKFLGETKTQPAKYVCRQCKAGVNCHKGTNIPLGYLANRKTRRLRAKAHREFDPLWVDGLMPRTDAYLWLARKLSLSPEEAHIGRLNETHLVKLIKACAGWRRKLHAKTAKKEARQNATDRRDTTRHRKRRNGGKWKPK